MQGRIGTIYTIGHSTHNYVDFCALLKPHGIELVVDVRSVPYSEAAPQFNQEHLRRALEERGFDYLFLGRELGGRPKDLAYYRVDKHGRRRVDYERVAQSRLFRDGIERLLRAASCRRVVVMCAELNPEKCHRSLLIGRVLDELGVVVQHILKGGKLQSQEELVEKLRKTFFRTQRPLLDEREQAWDVINRQARRFAARPDEQDEEEQDWE